MDEFNYRLLVQKPKRRCEACGATSYQGPDDEFRCVVCDHEYFETCLDCGLLHAWCTCPPKTTKKRKRRTTARSK